MPRDPRTSPAPGRRARWIAATASAGLLASALAGCAAGEGAVDESTLTLDYATYNPLSLVIREQGWLEAELEEQGRSVEWVESTGSNKANEALRAGAIDVGSTAGSAALLARANGSPIRTIDVYSQPEWAAIVVPDDSPLESVADLEGASVAATKGTDPYFFLLQALEEAGVDPADVSVENLQHADGATALRNGSVDAWAGLDPIMASAEQEGAELLHRDISLNTYGFLNATEDFLDSDPETAQLVVDAYARARTWIQDNPEEATTILAEGAGIDEAVAATVLNERTNLDFDHVPGSAQRDVLERIGPILVDSGDVAEQEQVDTALDELLDPTYAEAAQ